MEIALQFLYVAEGTGVEPVSPYGHWFSRPTHYRPAHPPLAEEARFELARALRLKGLANPRNGPGYATPP